MCYVVDKSAPESYRSHIPAQALRRRGIKADVVSFQDMPRYRPSQWNVFVFRMLVGYEEPMKQLVELLKQMGSIIVYDTDDDPHAHFGARRFDPLLVARMADVCTVPTPALRKKVPEAVVLPNCLDFSLWKYKPTDKPFTIGLAGGSSHLHDWRQVKEPMRSAQEKYGVRLLVGGYYPGYLRELNVKHIPWVKYSEYPDTIREIDILLCPLNDDEFNLYKSGIKAVEGMSQGCVPVCSDHPVYRRVVNNRHNGLLVKDGKWEEAISLLVEDRRLFGMLSNRAQKWVRKNRDINAWIPKWVQAYSEAWQSPV